MRERGFAGDGDVEVAIGIVTGSGRIYSLEGRGSQRICSQAPILTMTQRDMHG